MKTIPQNRFLLFMLMLVLMSQAVLSALPNYPADVNPFDAILYYTFDETGGTSASEEFINLSWVSDSSPTWETVTPYAGTAHLELGAGDHGSTVNDYTNISENHLTCFTFLGTSDASQQDKIIVRASNGRGTVLEEIAWFGAGHPSFGHDIRLSLNADCDGVIDSNVAFGGYDFKANTPYRVCVDIDTDNNLCTVYVNDSSNATGYFAQQKACGVATVPSCEGSAIKIFFGENGGNGDTHEGNTDDVLFFDYSARATDESVITAYMNADYGDSVFPSISNIQNNATADTRTGSNVNFSVDVSDNSALSSYTPQTNRSGSWLSEPSVDISGTSYQINHIISITEPALSNICYRFEVNDTSDNVNVSDISCFSVNKELIELHTPADNTDYNSPSINSTNMTFSFNFNATNCTLYINDTGMSWNPFYSIQAGVFNQTISYNETSLYIDFDGVLNYFDFEEGSGNITIDKSNNNNGTINGASYVSSKGDRNTGDYALEFTLDYVQVPEQSYYDIGNNDDIAFSAWIRSDHGSDGDYHMIIDFRDAGSDGMFVAIASDDTIQATLNDLTMSSSATITDNNWHHIVVIWDRDDDSATDIWVDNVSQSVGILSSTKFVNTNSDLYIGQRSFSAGIYWEGDLDEIYIFNSTLSDNDVSEIYKKGLYYNVTTELENSTLINLTLDQSQNYSTIYDFLPDTKQDILWYVNCYDGSIDSNSTIYEFSYLSDFTPPSIIVTPPNGTNSNDDEINIIAEIDESGTCTINNSDWTLGFSNDTFFNFTDTGVPDGVYLLNITCSDSYSNSDSITIEITKDRLEPFMTWIDPNDDNTSTWYFNISRATNIELFDDHLWAYQMLVYDPNMDLQYNFTQYDLGTDNYTVADILTPNATGNWTVVLTASDSHTQSMIENYEHNINDTLLRFTFENIIDEILSEENIDIEYIGTHPVNNISTSKKRDRYNFGFDFDTSGMHGNRATHLFKVSCTDIKYLDDSDYEGHFICPKTNNWIDFSNPDVINTVVYSCGSGEPDCYIIRVIAHPLGKMMFDSIGGLNINTETVHFEVVPAPIAPFDLLHINECPIDNTRTVLMFAFLLLVLILMYLACKLIIKIPIVTVVTGTGFIFYCFTLIGCNAVIGVIGIMVSIGLILEAVLR